MRIWSSSPEVSGDSVGTDEITQGAGPCQSRGPGMGSELTHIWRRAEEGEPVKEKEKGKGVRQLRSEKEAGVGEHRGAPASKAGKGVHIAAWRVRRRPAPWQPQF